MRPFTCRELSQREVKAKERRGPRRASSLFKVSALRGSGREVRKASWRNLVVRVKSGDAHTIKPELSTQWMPRTAP